MCLEGQDFHANHVTARFLRVTSVRQDGALCNWSDSIACGQPFEASAWGVEGTTCQPARANTNVYRACGPACIQAMPISAVWCAHRCGAVNRVLLHVLRHISVLDDRLALRHLAAPLLERLGWGKAACCCCLCGSRSNARPVYMFGPSGASPRSSQGG